MRARLSLMLLLSTTTAVAAPLEVRVDPRVELLSAVFRLADAREFSQGRSPYLEALTRQLAPFKGHAIVAATQKLRQEHGIGFDAPMQLALYLDEKTLRPRRPLRPRPPGLDARWERVAIDDYLATLRDFVEVAGWRAFLAAQAPHFRRVEERFRAFGEKHDLQPWIDATYGPRKGARSVLVPGLQSGSANFGIAIETARGAEHYQILALESPDDEGLPRAGEATLGMWAHEASHPYVNPLVDRHLAALRPPAEELYPRVAAEMKAQAYGDARVMVCESLVRAEVIRFLRARLGKTAARAAARYDEEIGFGWIDALVARLDAHGGTLAAAMPDVTTFFIETAARVRAEGLPRRSFRGPINAVTAANRRCSRRRRSSVTSPRCARSSTRARRRPAQQRPRPGRASRGRR